MQSYSMMELEGCRQQLGGASMAGFWEPGPPGRYFVMPKAKLGIGRAPSVSAKDVRVEDQHERRERAVSCHEGKGIGDE